MMEQKSSSVYLDDPQATSWVWKYQADADEWRFFADDYKPVVSIKIVGRYSGPPISCTRRGTTMPKEVREVVMRSGMTLFEMSDIGIFSMALDKAVVQFLTTMEWMKNRD